ncbi:nucleoside/nucleotide kinase family protein [Actinotalea sp. AC32]|nr:nucleoside/nucleotide kinase family protein [Actinotalea sp. AC32]
MVAWASHAGGGRVVLGIAGPPGAGKSTLAERVVDEARAAGVASVLVPMDGFHLAQSELERLGRADRKGAPDTFDAVGFVAALRRVREQRPGTPTVHLPRFDREIEEPVAGTVPVEPEDRLVVVEGNYLLHDDGPWADVRGLLDRCWYLDLSDDVRVARLVARHVAFGKEPAAARGWVLRSDERNARLVAAGRARADVVVRPD